MAGRKRIPIDSAQVEKLATIHCTQDEIAGFFDIARENFNRRVNGQDAEGETLRMAMERGRAKGRASLRRKQYEQAVAGNSTMLIWLGKNILGQKDVVVTEHAGEMTVHDGARDRLFSKLTAFTAGKRTEESDQRVN